MHQNQERDENYEPVTLPSAAEVLHWGDLHGDPAAAQVETPVAPPFREPRAADEGDDAATRFLPRRSRWRFLVASAVTLAAGGVIAWAVGSMSNDAGTGGLVTYFRAISTVVASLALLVWFWRWAARWRGGVPHR